MICDHLSAQSWLNLIRIIDDDEASLKEKPEYTRYIKYYIKMRPEAPVVWANYT